MSKSRSVVSIRFGGETQKEVEQYSKEREMGNAEAYRDLVRRGLDADEVQDHLDRIDKRLDRIEKKQSQCDEVQDHLDRIDERLDRIGKKQSQSLLERLL